MRSLAALFVCCWLAACGGRLSSDPGGNDPDGGRSSTGGGTSDGGSTGGGTSDGGSTGGRSGTGGRLGTGGSIVEPVGTGGLCPEFSTQCGDECVDLQSDPHHCGTCGNRCPTESEVCGPCGVCVVEQIGWFCETGTCVRSACLEHWAQCDASCVDICDDPVHCGACDHACPRGASCMDGQCECFDPSEVACADECVDIGGDTSHCGECDEPCAAGEVCTSGRCACPPDRTRCGGDCVDTSSNGSHCGGCGIACPAGSECLDGECLPSSWFACEAAEDCLVTHASCCGVCGAYAPDDVIALNRDEAQSYREEQCGPSFGCPECDAATVPSIAIGCVAGRCQLRPLDPDLTACTADDDCTIRTRQCCECGAPAEYVALSIEARSRYEALVCAPQQACGDCEGSYGDVAAECNDGRCRVRLF